MTSLWAGPPPPFRDPLILGSLPSEPFRRNLKVIWSPGETPSRGFIFAIHRPLKVAPDSLSFGETLMRSRMLLLAVALLCSGCMSTTIKPAISGVKSGDGNVKPTLFIEI